jgi:Amt family ammonium transporter
MHQDKKITKGSSVMRGLGAALLLMLPVLVFGADAAPPPPNKGDVSWLITATVLVILMTIPGLALFYGGMVRSKNVLSLLMQVFIVFCLASIVWAVYGYSIAFTAGDTQFFGGFSRVFMKGMTGDSLTGTFSKATNIPELGFFCFQLTFAAITPCLIVGAFAERVKFSAILVFMLLWMTFSYFPIAHMVWFWAGPDAYTSAAAADEVAKTNGFLFNKGALDFAGGTVVHINAGIAGLVGALMIGKRIGFGQTALTPHNVPMTMIGACLLWVGWFGFNAGSAVAAGSLATSAFVATHFATAAAVLGWMVIEWMMAGKPSVLGAISGAVAGLVAITPASGFVKPMPAILIGVAAGVICYLMVAKVKKIFGYDDALDAFGVHGIGGTLGALLTGVFATKEVNDLRMGKAMGMVDGDAGQLLNQAIAVLIAWGLAIVGTLVILKITDVICGVRVTKEQETEGLDLSLHGEEGYNLES